MNTKMKQQCQEIITNVRKVDLVQHILRSFNSTKLNKESLDLINGCHNITPSYNEESKSYEVPFFITLMSDKFIYEYKDINNISIDAADISFEVTLHNVTYSESTGWEWTPNKDDISFEIGELELNILLYNKGTILFDNEEDTYYTSSLTSTEELSKKICERILENTSDTELLEVVDLLISTIEV